MISFLFRFFAYLGLVVFLLGSSLCHADQQTNSSPIQWTVPAECGGGNDIVEKVNILLDDPDWAAYHKTIVGSVAKISDSWMVQLTIDDGKHIYQRVVKVHTCEAVLEVATLLTAMAVNPVGVLGSDDPELQASIEKLADYTVPTPSPSPDGAPMRGETVMGAKDATPSSALGPLMEPPSEGNGTASEMSNVTDHPMQKNTSEAGMTSIFSLGGGIGLDTGLTAPLRTGFIGTAAIHHQRWFIEGAGYYSPSATFPVSTPFNDVGWTSRTVAVSFGAGPLWKAKRVFLGWTIGMNAVYIRASAVGVVSPKTTTVWFPGSFFSGKFRWHFFSRGGLFFEPTLVVLWAKPQFHIEGIGVVRQTERIVGTGAVGFFLEWGKRK